VMPELMTWQTAGVVLQPLMAAQQKDTPAFMQ